jgi:hypothetical protein
MAYPTAIGCGCLLGAGGVSHLHAAEWSVQPTFSLQTDFDSDRNLSTQSQGSEEAVLYGDLRLQRAIENTQILIEPKFDLRRYSDSIWGPGNDRSLNAAFSWTGERLKASLTGYIANQTTLTTELLETGIINADTRRRTSQATGELDWSQSERRQAFLQANYLSTAFSGPPLAELELPGYDYSSVALGERFFLSERLTLAASAFGDALTSARFGQSSHEEGGQLELTDQYSEKTSFDVSVGQSKRSLAGERGNGTNVSLTASHSLTLGSAALSYVRSLVPYGTGVLVQRQQITATLTRTLAPNLDATFTALRIQNNASTVRLGLDRPYYNNTALGLNWTMGESWKLQPLLTTSWSKPSPPRDSPPGFTEPSVFEWRASLTLVWQPFPASRSR